jgi:hypothetical protein
MTATTSKDKLLEAVVGVALAGGIAGKSLRAIAEAAGTSHRMLIHPMTCPVPAGAHDLPSARRRP